MGTSEEWDRIFSGLNGQGGVEDAWLKRWRHVLEASRGSPILDLGCGAGHDTLFLTELGFPVVAADFSGEALRITRRRAPAAKTENVNLARGLPFSDAGFRVIVASLSLHYFPWQLTTTILNDVRRCLEPGGHLLARLNSTQDPRYTTAEKQEIETNYYLIEGMPKRLFDRHDVDTLFEEGWKILDASERVTHKYGGKKVLWEVAARKAESEARRAEAS